MDKEKAERLLKIKTSPYTKDILKQSYKVAVKNAHPDCGGSHEEIIEVNEAYTYLLSYFKYQKYVSLSSQPAQTYQDFAYWTSQINYTSEQQWAKVNEILKEVKPVRDEATKTNVTSAASNMKSSERDEPVQKSKTVQEILADTEKEMNQMGCLAIILRLVFFVICCIIFINIGSWDFVLNFGAFHFMDYWAGDFFSFIFCAVLLITGILNSTTGFFTDKIAGMVWLIKNVFKKKSS